MNDGPGVYLDYAATTPVDPRVAEAMCACLTGDGVFGNPASRSHEYGRRALEKVETAREQVAALVGADPREIIWTSGATESDNLAIKGAAHFYRNKGRHLVTVKTEHKAVLDSMRQLEREGYRVTYLAPQPDGLVDPEALRAALRPDTVLVSIMHVNNEIGVIQDIAALGAVCHEHGVLFHVDAAQSAGKLPIDLDALPVDLMSFSAHKVYGPKGVGALYVRRKPRVRLEAQIHGGGHERGMRSGTLPTHQIVGMGAAFALAGAEMERDLAHARALRRRLLGGFAELPGVYLNGHPERCLPGIVNLSFDYVEGESLLLGVRPLAVSSGSACTSASLEPSYVLRALGRDNPLAHSSLRFSFGRFTREADIDFAVARVRATVERLRALSPLWEMVEQGIDPARYHWATH
ncbi:MAG: cysteine desulfurase IscS [Gammaproteobacteria bacterium]|nr:MAG: cysteine desulfurase IscS [Gammaproteobacteria bacterium]